MKILLINPPHLAIGSRVPKEQLPPLGLLSIGGPLIDSGYEVILLDADYSNMKLERIVRETLKHQPEMVLMGHSGSTTAQPIIDEISKNIKLFFPEVKIIVGGVFPTYHWFEILRDNPAIDFIVCGEGEAVCLDLVRAIEKNTSLKEVKGIAFRIGEEAVPYKTPAAEPIQNLDAYRVGWELMNGYRYSYWGNKKAVVVQFSRGCPYPCNYCGQSLFWQKWRHRDPVKFAKELAMLHREYGIEVFNFADENPITNKKVWKAFLEAVIAENVSLILVGSARADNIVRDADILHLYKKAGFERFLLGIESYDESTLQLIKKKGTVNKDKEAIHLLRKHNILSMATYVVGFSDEKLIDYWHGLQQILEYDPDQIQLLYATPHKWTPYYHLVEDKDIVQPDQRKWDYKHQVLASPYLKPWQIILLVKCIEVILQIRPSALKRLFFHKDKGIRAAMRWYYKIGRKVWFYELYHFFFTEKRLKKKRKLNTFWQ